MTTDPHITYLSSPKAVNMGNDWFGIASLSHFWIRRRFEVLQRMLARVPLRGTRIAEIGCGNGLLQAQMAAAMGVAVDGFDLNLEALKKTEARSGNLYYYDIHDRRPELEKRYHSILLFDVIEHIEDEAAFMRSVLFHLAQDGLLYVNVPALDSLHSAYDTAVGHVRRYNIDTLTELAGRSGLAILEWTYWGLPMIPMLWLRKAILTAATDPHTIRTGFDSRNRIVNEALLVLSQCEWIPQQLCGTSLMAVLTRQTNILVPVEKETAVLKPIAEPLAPSIVVSGH